VYENQCGFAEDVGIFLNSCRLLDTQDRYAKTQVYAAATGKRGTTVRYDIPTPRVVVQDAAGSLLVAGDDASHYFTDLNEIFTVGWEEAAPDTNGSIYLQKSRP